MGPQNMEKLTPEWQTFDHIADIGIRGIGQSVEEAFENGARALFSLIVEDISAIAIKEKREINCSSYDLTGLFVAWINTLIAISDIEGLVFGDFRVCINDASLFGNAFGETWSLEKHGRGIEVKGATFSEAVVKKEDGLWIAQCIVDV